MHGLINSRDFILYLLLLTYFFFFFERIVSLIIVKMCKKVYIKVCYASFYLNDHLIRAPPRIFLKFGILDIVENINADQY